MRRFGLTLFLAIFYSLCRLALMTLLSRRYWPAMLASELGIAVWLHSEQLQTHWIILLSPFLSLIPAALVQHFWRRFTLYWQRLLLLLGAVPGLWLSSPLSQTLLASFTGGILLTPFIYLIYEYLKQQHLQDLLAQEIPDPPLRTSLLIWCSLFFALAVCLQMSLAPEVERLLIILVFLPNVVM